MNGTVANICICLNSTKRVNKVSASPLPSPIYLSALPWVFPLLSEFHFLYLSYTPTHLTLLSTPHSPFITSLSILLIKPLRSQYEISVWQISAVLWWAIFVCLASINATYCYRKLYISVLLLILFSLTFLYLCFDVICSNVALLMD